MLIFMVGIAFAPFIQNNTSTCCDSLMDQCCCLAIGETCEMEMTNCELPIVLPIVSAPLNHVSVEKELIISVMSESAISINTIVESFVYRYRDIPDHPPAFISPLLI